MFLLIRAIFWFSLVVLLLPIDTNAPSDAQAEIADVSAVEAFGAARATMADLSSFCERNPEACETGSAALAAFGQKAQASARMFYEYVLEADNATQGDRRDGSPLARDEATPERDAVPGSDTLRAGDLEVPWQGPEGEDRS